MGKYIRFEILLKYKPYNFRKAFVGDVVQFTDQRITCILFCFNYYGN